MNNLCQNRGGVAQVVIQSGHQSIGICNIFSISMYFIFISLNFVLTLIKITFSLMNYVSNMNKQILQKLQRSTFRSIQAQIARTKQYLINFHESAMSIVRHDQTDVHSVRVYIPQYSQQQSVPDLSVLTVAFLALKKKNVFFTFSDSKKNFKFFLFYEIIMQLFSADAIVFSKKCKKKILTPKK